MSEGGRTTMMHAVQTMRRLSYSREARQGSHKRRKICNARSHAQQQQQQHPSILFLSSSRSQRALGLYTPTLPPTIVSVLLCKSAQF